MTQGKYTQQELLLLSNFVYIPVCTSSATLEEIIEPYRDPSGNFTAESVAQAAAGGGMSADDVAVVFDAMDKRIARNPDFGKLSAARTLEENNVRAVCYTGPKDEDPVVAFRGTGGTKDAWSDNFEGAFCEDTDIQKTAGDFLKHECALYDDIVVTGHSKGGNLAQYVTVKNQDKISACVSFDGQGFSDEFIKENDDAVKLASPKICSISAYNDFVNILLTGIAGTYLYVANGASAADAHSSVTLLTENEFDENGNFTTLRGQSALSKALSAFADMAVGALSGAGAHGKEAFSDIMGSSISAALTTPPDKIKEGVIAPALGQVLAQFTKDAVRTRYEKEADMPVISRSLYIDTAAVAAAADTLEAQRIRIESLTASVNRLRQELAYTISSRICAERALGNICEDLSVISRKIGVCSSVVKHASDRYSKCEGEAVALMDF